LLASNTLAQDETFESTEDLHSSARDRAGYRPDSATSNMMRDNRYHGMITYNFKFTSTILNFISGNILSYVLQYLSKDTRVPVE
jgi:hypothetical protein